jgi:hypothetical protein
MRQLDQIGEGVVMAVAVARIDRAWSVPGIAGIGFLVSWIAALSIPAPSPKFSATGTQIISAYAGHQDAVAMGWALSEGLPAIGLVVVSVTLAAAARRSGAVAVARVALTAGLVAAVISLTMAVMGLVQAWSTAPGTAHTLYDLANRLDGVKMITLAVLGAAGAACAVLPRWLRWGAAALAVSMAISGMMFLLLVQSMANPAAAPALILLLLFIPGTGLVLGPRAAGE